MNSLAMSRPKHYPIPNQDINMLRTEKYQRLPPQLAKFCPGYKSFIGKAEYGRKDSTDTSHTDREDSVNNLKYIHN